MCVKDYFLSLNFTTQVPHRSGIHNVFDFVTGLLHLHSIMTSRFIHLILCVRISFHFKAEYPILCIYYILFIYSPVDGHLGCFYHLAIVTNAAMNMDIQLSA